VRERAAQVGRRRRYPFAEAFDRISIDR
jgi:hypothetical protein